MCDDCQDWRRVSWCRFCPECGTDLKTVKCRHPSFALVEYQMPYGLDPGYKVCCYHCREELPFFFYERKEWEAMKDENTS